MAKKLYYFNINGLGEAIRYMLHYGNQKFEDVRYDYKSWPIHDIKESLPFGQLPIYEDGGRRLNQSFAIARYVAQEAKLVPSDLWEQAELDATVLNFYDYLSKITPYVKEQDPEKKEAMRKQIPETVDFYFSRFEKELKSNNGFFAGKLTWADFMLVGLVETTQLTVADVVFQEYPTVLALCQKITSLPGVKEYIATRKPYVF